jgi:hypothetical protein
MDRYEEAVREFQERQSAPQENAPGPTEEEIGAYNAALHAWLDEDMERMASMAPNEARDPGAPALPYAQSAGALGRLLGISGDAFSRPGLPESKSLQPRPGLTEGLSELRT